MPYYCTVPRCTSMAGKAKNVSFHQFPRDEELARLWNDILKRGKPYTKYSKVCSLHFKPEDYTITSVGKNKGQWRTLRKDAVPSQNLPSETPAPYTRKQWESWNHTTPNVIDPTIHQQMAQAIYMQTMLAMQAAATEPPHHQNDITDNVPQTSNQDKESDITSYRCTECTKCFKDPDVFILHKRSHTKKNGVEKENYNMNLTLRSNPILANLLKTNNEANFDPNLATMESILMTALAANMDYLRNYSMVKERSEMNHDIGDVKVMDRFNHSGEVNRDTIGFNHDSGEENRDIDELNDDSEEVNRDMSGLNVSRDGNRDMSGLNDVSSEVNRDIDGLNHNRDETNHDRETDTNENVSLRSFSDLRVHKRSSLIDSFSQNTLRKSPPEDTCVKGLIQPDSDAHTEIDLSLKDTSNSDDENHQNEMELSYAMNFSTKIENREVYKDTYKDYSEGTSYSAGGKNDGGVNESIDSNLVVDEST